MRRQKGEPKKKAPIACIGAGTGLGEVYLTVDNGHYVAYPSEGGHAEFPPRTDLEVRPTEKGRREAAHRDTQRLETYIDLIPDGRLERVCHGTAHVLCCCLPCIAEACACVVPTLQFEMLSYLKTKYQAKHRVSVERVISGPGLANV